MSDGTSGGTSKVLTWGVELATLVDRGRPEGLSTHRAATAVAEEVGECIGAHNKIADGRVKGDEHFRQEWSQAMLMLVMLGSQYMNTEQMEQALAAEMNAQRDRWAPLP